MLGTVGLLLCALVGSSFASVDLEPSHAPSTAPSPAPPSLHGLCYLDFEDLTQATPINVEDGQLLDFSSLGVSDEFLSNTNETSYVFCIWFQSHINANLIIESQFLLSEQILNVDKNAIKQGNNQGVSTIDCYELSFEVSIPKKIESYHLCSNDCQTPSCDELFTTQASIDSIESIEDFVDSGKSTDITQTWVWTVGIIILVICAILFIVALFSYFVTLCRSRSNANQTQNMPKQTKTEEVIGEVLDEIAKYTIGEADEDFLYKEDWLYDPSSDSEDGQVLGDKILHAVKSNVHLPNLPDSPLKSTKNNSNMAEINTNTNTNTSANANLNAVILTHTNSHNTSNAETSIEDSTSDTEIHLRAVTSNGHASLVQRRVVLGDAKNRIQSISKHEELGDLGASMVGHGELSMEEKKPTIDC